MNVVAEELLERVRTSTTVLLTGPEGPDGDSIGACLALQRLFAERCPEVTVDVAGVPGLRYGWMPGADRMLPDAQIGSYDAVIVLDGDRTRLPPAVSRAFAGARWTGIVDHHRSTAVSDYTVAVFDPKAESTCGMVAGLAATWGVGIDATLAQQLYVGLIFDTGGFRYSNTSESTHRLAAELLATGIDHAGIMLRVLVERRKVAFQLLASLLAGATFSHGGRMLRTVCTQALRADLGAEEPDLEGVVDVMQHTQGVDLAVVIVERGPRRVKLSLRSSGRVDVAALARRLSPGGGGHAKAAGAQLDATVEEVSAALCAEADALFS